MLNRKNTLGILKIEQNTPPLNSDPKKSAETAHRKDMKTYLQTVLSNHSI